MMNRKMSAAALAVLVAAGVSSCGKPVTATTLAAEINKQMSFPKDLGDGFRLDSITASGNDLVSTVTMTQIPSGADLPQLADALATASKSDTCRELASTRQQYVAANIRVAKVFKDAAGAEVVRVIVDPRECT